MVEYDSVGNLDRRTDRNGRVIEYLYDRLDRPTDEYWYQDTAAADLGPGNELRLIEQSYDLAGRMLTSTDPDHSYTYTYDALDRTTVAQRQITGLTPTVALLNQFDAAGNRRLNIGLIGFTVSYMNDSAYDGLNRLTSVVQQQYASGHAVAPKRVDFGYDLVGQLDWIQRYASLDTSAAVAVSDFDWDQAGRLTTLAHFEGTDLDPFTGTLLAGYDYDWNQRHELEQLDFLPGNFGYTSSFDYSTEDVTSYNYDPRGQLTGATYTGQTTETYAYDDNGNRTNGGFTPGKNNRLITDGVYNYTYDNEGNITKQTRISGTDLDGTKIREFTWDHRNRLIKVTSKNTSNQEINRVEYTYDGTDKLVGRKVFLNGSATPSEQQAFLYDNGQIVLDFNKTGSGSLATADLAHRYLWGPAVDQLLADEDVSSLTYAAENHMRWPLTDHLGTPRDWIDSAGALIDHAIYDTYGNRLNADAIDAAFEWTARYRDPLTGLQYNDGRWYKRYCQLLWMKDFVRRRLLGI